MLFKHMMMPATTSSSLPMVNNGEKHVSRNTNHLFFKLPHDRFMKDWWSFRGVRELF